MKKVLFVCTGNTCRSPMAEALFKLKAGNEFEGKSAGIFANPGSPASAQVVEVLGERKIAVDHSSTVLEPELLEWADIVLTMTSGHRQMILRQHPDASNKVFVLKEFVNDNEKQVDISDPFGGSVELYRQTSEEIEQAIEKLLYRLSKSE